MPLSPEGRRGLIVFLIGLFLVACVLAFTAGQLFYRDWWGRIAGGPSLSPGEQVAPVSIGGDFALTDQNGQVRHPADFRGTLMLVYFGYSYCPDACPTALQDMSSALDALGPKGDQVQPIFITIDPERDTAAQLKLYAENFHPRLLALTGTTDQVAEAARAYRVFYQKANSSEGGDYLMDHSSFIYLMGRDGNYISHFGPGITAEEMAAAIARHL
jgi:protein SCO1